MNNKEKARQLAIQSTKDVDDNGNEIYNAFVEAALLEMAEWKDEQMVEKACELYRTALVSLNNLLVAYDKEAFANLIMIDDSVVDFRNMLKKAIKEEQND